MHRIWLILKPELVGRHLQFDHRSERIDPIRQQSCQAPAADGVYEGEERGKCRFDEIESTCRPENTYYFGQCRIEICRECVQMVQPTLYDDDVNGSGSNREGACVGGRCAVTQLRCGDQTKRQVDPEAVRESESLQSLESICPASEQFDDLELASFPVDSESAQTVDELVDFLLRGLETGVCVLPTEFRRRIRIAHLPPAATGAVAVLEGIISAEMSTIFGDYAAYYDLLYSSKDYAEEAGYVADLLKRHGDEVTTILEIGCGTGRHAELLAGMGYRIVGVDKSREMLRHAERRREANEEHAASVRFIEGDARSLDLGERFDAVISLFHTMAYLSGDEELRAAFRSVRRHLDPGGLFLFDFWYGPAVLRDPPTAREKRIRVGDLEFIRTATPEHFPDQNRVDVRYAIRSGGEASPHEVRETHSMRYLFLPGLADLLRSERLEPRLAARWLSGLPPDETSWNACILAAAV
jgi:SAM-dependent methyltransferase